MGNILNYFEALMIFNALSVTIKNSDQTLADFLGIDMPVFEAGELEVVDVYAENLKEVIVELSNAKLADEEKLENVNNYKLLGFAFEKATLDGNNVILLIKGENNHLVRNRAYELTIRNIDKDVNGTYKFTARDNSIPAVEEVEVLGEYGIKVTTTEPVNNPRERNFLVDGKNIAMDIEQYGRVIILTPYYDKEFPSNAETLTIKGLEDFAGYKSVEEDWPIEIVKDEVAPEVVDVLVMGNVVDVIFDKDVYIDSIEAYVNRNRTGNISYKDGRHEIYADDEEKLDVNKVRYTFEKELPRKPQITISGVTNHSNVKMNEITVEGKEVLDYSEPVIIDFEKSDYVRPRDAEGKYLVDQAGLTITLYFDKDVTGKFLNPDEEDAAKLEFDPEEHFDIYEREVHRRNKLTVGGENSNFGDYFKSVKYGSDKDGIRKDIIVIELEGLNVNNSDKDYDYVLEVRNFEDTTILSNRMYRDYVEFDIPRLGTAFEIETIKIVKENSHETEIAIDFSKPVDRELAENPTNYLFKVKNSTTKRDVEQLNGEIFVERSGYTVTIVLPRFNKANYDILEVSQAIKDIYGARLAKTNTVFDFTTEETRTPADEIGTELPDEIKLTAANITQEKIDKVEADVARGTLESLTIGNFVVIKIGSDEYSFEIKQDSENASQVDFDGLVGAINAANLIVKAELNNETSPAGIVLEANEGVEEFLYGIADGSSPVSYKVAKEVKAVEAANQEITLTFTRTSDLLAAGQVVTITDNNSTPNNYTGKIKNVTWNKVVVEMDEGVEIAKDTTIASVTVKIDNSTTYNAEIEGTITLK